MNTNDFYKELFEKYALDEDKIRRNALKAGKTPAWQRAVGNHWKTFAGAAAAVTLTVGAVAYMSGNPGEQGIDIVSPDNLLSASQRLQEAEQNYYNISAEENEILNIYLTFKENVCYSDMAVFLSALEDSDKIEIQRLYLNDSSVVTGMSDISGYAEKSPADKCISGAKISAPAGCYRDLNDLSRVDVAEIESEKMNDSTFAPLVRDDSDPLASDMLSITTTAPAVTTAPFSFESETTTAAVTTTVETTTEVPETEITEDVSDGVEVVPDEPEITVGTDDDYVITTPEELDDPELTAQETTAETTAEITVSSEDFEAPDMGLMTRIYQLNAPNALETVLIGDHAIVLCRDQVYFFTLAGVITDSRPRAVAMGSPKIAYSDNDKVIVTGCDENGRRNTVVMLDLNTNVLYGNDNDTNIGTSEVGRVYCSASDGKYFVSTFADSNTYLYEMTVDAQTGLQFRPLVEFPGPVAVAGYKDGVLWFTGSEDNVNYNLYAFDCVNGALENCAEIGQYCRVQRSLSFGSFILTATGASDGLQRSYIFDIRARSLITVATGDDPMIADLNGAIYVSSNGVNYRLTEAGTLEVTDVNVNYTRQLRSSFAIVTQDSEKIMVAETNTKEW